MITKTSSISSIEQVRNLFEEYSEDWICGKELSIKPGDWYWAQRNGPPQILQCKFINKENGWIFATVHDYPYYVTECFKAKKTTQEDDFLKLAVQAEIEFKAWSNSWINSEDY